MKKLTAIALILILTAIALTASAEVSVLVRRLRRLGRRGLRFPDHGRQRHRKDFR